MPRHVQTCRGCPARYTPQLIAQESMVGGSGAAAGGNIGRISVRVITGRQRHTCTEGTSLFFRINSKLTRDYTTLYPHTTQV